jgi:hypothetical protein
MKRLLAACTLSLSLVASLATSKAPTDSGLDSATRAACLTLSVTDCEADPACSTIDGRSLDGECVDYSLDPEPQGCQARDLSCPAVELVAAPAEDPTACLLFQSGCIPEGWVVCEDFNYEEC